MQLWRVARKRRKWCHVAKLENRTKDPVIPHLLTAPAIFSIILLSIVKLLHRPQKVFRKFSSLAFFISETIFFLFQFLDAYWHYYFLRLHIYRLCPVVITEGWLTTINIRNFFPNSPDPNTVAVWVVLILTRMFTSFYLDSSVSGTSLREPGISGKVLSSQSKSLFFPNVRYFRF